MVITKVTQLKNVVNVISKFFFNILFCYIYERQGSDWFNIFIFSHGWKYTRILVIMADLKRIRYIKAMKK